MTFTDFLTRMLDDDEAAARTSRPDEHLLTRDRSELRVVEAHGYSAVAVTSGRVLAEVAAKRAILDEHRLVTDPARLVKVWRDPTPGVACERCAGDPLGDRPIEDIGVCDTLLALASVYSDHPDFDQAWNL